MLRVFIGWDHRQPVLVSTLAYSIYKYASVPVSVTPIIIQHVNKLSGFKRMGLTPFTYSRFLVPYLCNYEGWGLFLDADILVKHDIKELFDYADDKYSVMVSKNEHKFEWASVMLFNNAKCKILTPEFVDDENERIVDGLTNKGLHQIRWAKEEEVGDLPREWNHLVGYDKPRDDAKLIHYTQASPANVEALRCEYLKDWRQHFNEMNSTASWTELMGNSIHAKEVEGIRVPKFMEGQDLKDFIAYKKQEMLKGSADILPKGGDECSTTKKSNE